MGDLKAQPPAYSIASTPTVTARVPTTTQPTYYVSPTLQAQRSPSAQSYQFGPYHSGPYGAVPVREDFGRTVFTDEREIARNHARRRARRRFCGALIWALAIYFMFGSMLGWMASQNFYIGHRAYPPPKQFPKTPAPRLPGDNAHSDCRLYREWMKSSAVPFDGKGKPYSDIVQTYDQPSSFDVSSSFDFETQLQTWPVNPIGKDVLDKIRKDWERLKKQFPVSNGEKLNRQKPTLPTWEGSNRLLTFDIRVQDTVDALVFQSNGSLSNSIVDAVTEDKRPVRAMTNAFQNIQFPSHSKSLGKSHTVKFQINPRFDHRAGEHAKSFEEEEENETLDLVHVCLINSPRTSSASDGAVRGVVIHSPKTLPSGHPARTKHLNLIFSVDITLPSALKSLDILSVTSTAIMSASVDLPGFQLSTTEISSPVGDLDLTNFKSSSLTAVSVAGAIKTNNVDISESLLVGSAAGNLDLHVSLWKDRAIPLSDPAYFNVSTATGHIDLTLNSQPLGKVLVSNFAAATGTIDVKYPKEWEGDISLSNGYGTASVTLPSSDVQDNGGHNRESVWAPRSRGWGGVSGEGYSIWKGKDLPEDRQRGNITLALSIGEIGFHVAE